MLTCGQCGRESADDARFCAGCGTPLETSAAAPAREERKVVTVVFADLVGSTARAEALDPEDVRAILAPYHERLRHDLERHGGTVEKFIGDAVVAVFGAPVAHEDDPERAVRAALAIQEAIDDLNEADASLDLAVRIGVNTGEALVSLDVRPEAGEGIVSGDVINTAARLQAAAPPGGILVGEQTYRATDRRIEFTEHPSIEAKGKAAPVAVWLATGRRAGFGVDLGHARAPLVGREREVSLLSDALVRIRSADRPQLVTLVGVPGIGKSRLLYELLQLVEETPELITWRQGRSLPYGEGVAFWALGEIVKAQAGILESDGVDEATAKLDRAVHDLLTERTEAAWVERQLRPLVGLGDARGSTEGRGESFAAWRRFLEVLADGRPAVLVFEDLHWADDDLLDFVDELVDRGEGPLLVVCTARPELLERRPTWGGGKLNAVTLALTPLSDEDTARLFAALSDRGLMPAEQQAELLAQAGGIPLFAEEAARMLQTGEGGALPDTLHGILAARIDGLGADEKLVLQDAAVLGKVFWSDALAALSEIDAGQLDEWLYALERKEFVRRERRSSVVDARQYVFAHALLRDVAYGQIPRAARCSRHRRAAAWIESLSAGRSEDRSELLAHHLLSAIELGNSAGVAVDDLRAPAIRALREAGERASALASPRTAARFYERALEIAGEEEADPELLYRLGQARSHGEGEGEAELERAAAGLIADGRKGLAAEALVVLHNAAWHAARGRGFELLDRALALVADEQEATYSRGYVIATVGRFYGLGGRHEEAIPLDTEAIAIAEQLGDRDLLAYALNNLGTARCEAGDFAGLADIERSLAIGLEIGSGDVARAYINVGSITEALGNVTRAEEVHRAGLEAARRTENAISEQWLRAELANDWYRLGRWEDALREIEAYPLNRDEPRYMDGNVVALSLSISEARGSRPQLDDLEWLVALGSTLGDPQAVLPMLSWSARMAEAAGELDEAERYLDELTRRSAALSPEGSVGGWVYDAAATAVRLGMGAEVSALVAEGTGSRYEEAALAMLGGDPAAAADVLAEIPSVLEEADARVLAAEADPDAAAVQLERALEIYRRLGATARISRAESLLTGLGRRAG